MMTCRTVEFRSTPTVTSVVELRKGGPGIEPKPGGIKEVEASRSSEGFRGNLGGLGGPGRALEMPKQEGIPTFRVLSLAPNVAPQNLKPRPRQASKSSMASRYWGTSRRKYSWCQRPLIVVIASATIIINIIWIMIIVMITDTAVPTLPHSHER